MLNQQDILSTIEMIDQQHLDIRTITMGISLLSCCDPDPKRACDKIYEKITRYAEKLVRTGEEIEQEFAGKGYGDFKPAVAEAVIEELRPIQERFRQFIGDKAYLEQCYKDNAPKAQRIARKTLQKVMKKVGYLPL